MRQIQQKTKKNKVNEVRNIGKKTINIEENKNKN